MSPGFSKERMNYKHGSGGWGRMGRVLNVKVPGWPFPLGYKKIMKVTEQGSYKMTPDTSEVALRAAPGMN